METISVHASRDYEVRIGSGLLTRTGELSAPLIKGRHAMIVSDSNVWPLYGSMVQASLEDAGFQVDHFIFPAGEQSKNTDTLVQLLTCLAQKGMTRSDGVFALGGGVTGDMAGLAASLYLRGIPCVQLPTSLLSVVDSSVGGKTAVDLPEGKNLVGTFTQPHRSQELINFLLENTPGTDIEWVIAHCVSIKRDVVAQDEQDNAVRQVLNFGHTIGHAIERCGGYSIYHGEGVAMGMAIMTRACVRQKKCPPACWTVLETLLDKYHLPKTTDKSIDELLEAAHADKKRRGDAITLIQPEVLGNCVLYPTNYDELRRVLELGMPL